MDFTPVWRKWFIDLARIINRSGGTDGGCPASRQINTEAPLEGGGDLTEDRTISLGNQGANTVLAAPNGSSGAPSFRALVAEDMPGESVNIVTAKLTPLGNEGELVFVNGVLMAHTQAT
jgi:hypothetical protein